MSRISDLRTQVTQRAALLGDDLETRSFEIQRDVAGALEALSENHLPAILDRLAQLNGDVEVDGVRLNRLDELSRFRVPVDIDFAPMVGMERTGVEARQNVRWTEASLQPDAQRSRLDLVLSAKLGDTPAQVRFDFKLLKRVMLEVNQSPERFEASMVALLGELDRHLASAE